MNEGRKILIASEAGISIKSVSDISDAISACLDADGLLLTEADLTPEFFNLRSGLAGEVFQKFVNYRIRLALVVPHPEAHGERFKELAYEHSTHNMIRIVSSKDQAEIWLHS